MGSLTSLVRVSKIATVCDSLGKGAEKTFDAGAGRAELSLWAWKKAGSR